MSQKQLLPWNSVVSGTTAAVLANVLVYPLDIVKTRLQVQVQRQKDTPNNDTPAAHDVYYTSTLDAILQILRDEGIPGLYSGLGSSLTGTAAMNFAYFYWSAAARSLHQTTVQSLGLSDSNSIIKEFGLGAVGGAMAQLCTNPIAVVSTRQQTRKAYEEKLGFWDTVMQIVHGDDGWTGLWRGFKVNLILVVNPMITYGFYQWLRGRLLVFRKDIGALEAFLLGACSKVLATLVTHPLIVAKTMLQSDPPESRKGRPFTGFTQVLRYIIRREGVLRLYKGLAPQIVKGFLVQGLMMLLKERTEILLMMAISLHRRRLLRQRK
ncbi:mitochondrial carrier domain-containing protein [Aspergillus unguis]